MTDRPSSRIHSHLTDSLPALGWVATIGFMGRAAEVNVWHGHLVEVNDVAVVEGVWPESFEDRNFHRSEHFFGSGIRLVEEGAWLVPSRALVDRIFYCTTGPEKWVASNSLVSILAFMGASLDPNNNYRRQAYTILRGIEGYDSAFPVRHEATASLSQQFYDPVLITPNGDSSASSPAIRTFSGFSSYKNAMAEVVEGLGQNLANFTRSNPLDAYSTISQGYDSAAVTALVRGIGLRAAFTSAESNSTIPSWISHAARVDDGSEIASILGVPSKRLRHPEEGVSTAELHFLAGASDNPEIIFHGVGDVIRQRGRGAALFTGYHGDKVWDANLTQEYQGQEMKRGDISGLTLAEARLALGFINIPLPFVFARSVKDIVRISRSSEMKPWRLGTDYDRPIPRRILEELGVPRDCFGQRKKAVVSRYSFPVNPSLRRAFLESVQARTNWRPTTIRLREKVNHSAFLLLSLVERAARLVTRSRRNVPTALLAPELDLTYDLHMWSLTTLADAMRSRMESDGVSVLE